MVLNEESDNIFSNNCNLSEVFNVDTPAISLILLHKLKNVCWVAVTLNKLTLSISEELIDILDKNFKG